MTPAAQPGAEPPLALVTGGAKRIGAALATALAARGHLVAIHCNRSVAEGEALAETLASNGAPRPLVVTADLAREDCANRIFAQLPAAPTLLVNNASLFVEDQLGALDPALWEAHLAVNLRAPVLLMQRFATSLPVNATGLVVNLSDAKLASPNADFFSYTISKMALAGATELAARALAPRIRVNAIAPAVTLVSGPQSRANFEAAHVLNPLGRGVDVVDLVRALLYLVDTPTVTGQTLTIDSGQRFLGLPRDVAYMVPDA
jgi:NAD(P)-dependent dehydrogenase (short-subunit alcohol dehydrogenase family)